MIKFKKNKQDSNNKNSINKQDNNKDNSKCKNNKDLERKNYELYLDFKDVLIKPNLSYINSRKNVDLKFDTYSYTNNPLMKDWQPIPIMSANMDTVTGKEMAIELVKNGMIAVLHKFVPIEDISFILDFMENNNIDTRNLFVSRGATSTDKQKLLERLEKEPRIKSVCIDVANGHSINVIEYIKELKDGICKDKILMAGNIVFDENTLTKYIETGLDIIKMGIGQGSGCLTRVETGVGMPQIGMLLETKNFMENNILICSDGGCSRIGDIAKAFVAGADFVMLGGMLAGHTECPGEIEVINGEKLKRFSGMAAKESQKSGVPEYGVAECKTVFLKDKGSVKNTINNIYGGLRSACSYTNSANIKDLSNAEFILTHIQENNIFN